MKNLHVNFGKGKWWFDFILMRFDIKKAVKSGRLDVLFGIGLGWFYPANRFSKKKRLFFKLNLPKFNVKESDYKTLIYWESN